MKGRNYNEFLKSMAKNKSNKNINNSSSNINYNDKSIQNFSDNRKGEWLAYSNKSWRFNVFITIIFYLFLSNILNPLV